MTDASPEGPALRLVKVTLDEASIGRGNPDQEHERAGADEERGWHSGLRLRFAALGEIDAEVRRCMLEYGSVYDVFANPQTSVAQRFAATSLRNRPDEVEARELLAKPGRLFTVDLSEDSGFFGAAEQARKRGVVVEPVHAGIATLQERSFGKMTVRLNGDNAAINEFVSTLQRNTEIEEITR